MISDETKQAILLCVDKGRFYPAFERELESIMVELSLNSGDIKRIVKERAKVAKIYCIV